MVQCHGSTSRRLAGARPHDRGRLPASLRSAAFALALALCACGGESTSSGPPVHDDAGADVSQVDAGERELEAAPYDAPSGPQCPFVPCKDGQSP